MISENDISSARILIVDDVQANLDLLEAIVESAGYTSVMTLSDSRESVKLYEAFEPHLVILDINMPHLDGFQVMELLQEIEKDSYIPVMVVTAYQDDQTRKKALAWGAQDFLSKPFDDLEVKTRIRNMIRIRLLHNQTRNQNIILEQKIKLRTRQLEKTKLEIIHKLGQAAEYRDTETGAHIIRTSRMCGFLGRLSGMNEKEVDLLGKASCMHDVGKIGIPDAILLKPGKLSAEEWKTMTEHTLIGGKLLDGHDDDLMVLARDIALTHHEKWDGTGYPKGLKREDIPFCGRIAGLVDVFDALTSSRPYKEPYPIEKSLEIISRERGSHFDPDLVPLFFDHADVFIKIREELSDGEEMPRNEYKLSERDRT
ncbi:MAG: response regulator [Desulfobacteraceae bacterium]